MKMLNVGVIMGRLVAQPELRVTGNKTSVISFTVAVERDYVQNGERQTDFIDCVAWRQTAEFLSRNFRKGDMIAVNGRIQTRTYEDSSGKRQKRTELIAESINFCGNKGTSAPRSTDTAQIGEEYEVQEVPDSDEHLPF